MRAKVAEIFSSIQGEGLYAGCRQVFVRFCGCNLRCAYCDTVEGLVVPAQVRIEQVADRGEFYYVDNPLTSSSMAGYINKLLQIPHHSVSFTGGEPLWHAEFIAKLVPELDAEIYLETNGTLPDRLAVALPYVDIISMDIKLPSVLDGRELWSEHERFLRLAHTCKQVFVKIVISAETTDAELQRAFKVIASVDKNIPLVLQPVTPHGSIAEASLLKLMHCQAEGLRCLTDVRVIPQMHRMLGCL